MLRLLAIFSLIFFTTFFITTDAFAKRFGGGKSFGMQRSITQRQPHLNNTPHQTSHAAPQSKSNRFGYFGAALAGIAAGGLLSYLFMGHGLGASLLSWLAIGTVILLIVQFLRQRKTAKVYSTGMHNHVNNHLFESAAAEPISKPFNATVFSNDNTIPNFDEADFLREVKAKFIRLQAAFDQQNLNDIREFTLPEVFAEIQLQLNERGDVENYTEVVSLEADLLEAINEFQIPVASVKFSGQLKENKNMLPISFNETWHFKKENGAWKVAGIQQ